MSKLNPKQLKFCHEYLIDFNATQAAIRSGYSKRSAGSIAAENLQKPEIRDEINRLSASGYLAQGLSVGRIISEVTSIAFNVQNTKNERLKALEMLLKHKVSEPVKERNFSDTARTILERLSKIRENKNNETTEAELNIQVI